MAIEALLEDRADGLKGARSDLGLAASSRLERSRRYVWTGSGCPPKRGGPAQRCQALAAFFALGKPMQPSGPAAPDPEQRATADTEVARRAMLYVISC
jgi:hypothetical protein